MERSKPTLSSWANAGEHTASVEDHHPTRRGTMCPNQSARDWQDRQRECVLGGPGGMNKRIGAGPRRALPEAETVDIEQNIRGRKTKWRKNREKNWPINR